MKRSDSDLAHVTTATPLAIEELGLVEGGFRLGVDFSAGISFGESRCATPPPAPVVINQIQAAPPPVVAPAPAPFVPFAPVWGYAPYYPYPGWY